MAALEQELRNVAHDVDTLAPVQMAVVRIEEQIKQVHAELSGLREAVVQDRATAKAENALLTAQIKAMAEASADDARDARRTLRNGMWGIGAALIVAGGGIVAAGAHP